jgi:hypothetical protein
MADLVMIATMVGFVLLCIGYVRWCDGFIAADQADAPGDASTDREPAAAHEQVAA